jgi:transposase
MQTITTIGFDIAKSVFQVHGVDAVGQVIVRRQLKRRHVSGFPEASAMPGRHRGVRVISLLVARAPRPWSQDAADATGLREALRQATEKRCR